MTYQMEADGMVAFCPEYTYLQDGSDLRNRFFLVRVAERTALCLAGLADHFGIWSRVSQNIRRDGELAGSVGRRRLAFAQALEWAGGVVLDLSELGIKLMRSGQVLLDMHDGPPGQVYLRPEEFAMLQQAWRQEGLPDDLYFPCRDAVVTPIISTQPLGFPARGSVRLSPRAVRQQREVPSLGQVEVVKLARDAEARLGRASSRYMKELLRYSAMRDLVPPTAEDAPLLPLVNQASERVTDILVALANRLQRQREAEQ